MINRFATLAAFAVAATVAADARGQAAAIGFSGFSQTSPPSTVSYTQIDSTTVRLSATSQVNFTVSDPSFLTVPPPPENTFAPATLTLTAQSSNMVNPAGGGLGSQQGGFAGTFEIRESSGSNRLLLSGMFTNALLSQEREGRLSFESTNILNNFASDVFVQTIEEGFLFGIQGGFTVLGTSGGFYNNFSGNRIDGGFTALPIPEPASLAMAGLGVLALPVALRVARRRKAGTPS